MEPRHYLRCLGHPALFAPNGELIRFRTKKHLALLVYLALEQRRTHRRDRLAELLWPKADTSEARHSLATALSILRPRLGVKTLETTRDLVSLQSERLSLDIDRLVAKDVLGTEYTDHLEVAAFLDGFDISDAPEFALWKDRQQARLLPLIKDALLVLIDRCRRTGQSRQAEQLADRMLALDELSEEAVRAKMEARALAGDRLSALKLFEEWKSKVSMELQARPSLHIEQMATRLRRGGWEQTAINDIPTLPTDHGRDRAFVGRAREYSLLYETWEKLAKGRALHSLVLGDSGVGKTTLVERVTTAASLEGAAVARVQSYDLERNIPFATLGGLVLGLLDRAGASATPSAALAELARAVPEVRRRFANLPEALDSQGETARIRLTEAFHELLKAIAEEHPVILVVDDLHLADEASLAVLHLVLRRATEEPIMALFTARPGELRESDQAVVLRHSLNRQGCLEIPLQPLDEGQSLELLHALIPQGDPRPTSTVQRSLINASGGYPMVLELLVQDWRANGSRSIALSLEAMTTDFVERQGQYEAYGALLSRIVGALGQAARSVLDLASVLGGRLNDLSMYSVVDLSLGQTMAALGQLSEVRILRDGEKGLEFANELIRAHAYSAVPSSVRKALHASVADRLRFAQGPLRPTLELEIAWHTMRAGRTEEAVPHLLEGARVAMRCGAPQSAERALSSACPSLKGQELVEATFLLVQAFQEQGRWQDSLAALEPLRDLTSAERSQEAFALGALAKAYLEGSLSQETFNVIPALKEIMRTCPHLPSRIRAARAAAHSLAPFRERALAQDLLGLIHTIPANERDPDSIGQVALIKALLLHQSGDHEASFRVAEAALRDLQHIGAANLVAVQLQMGLGVTRSLQGRYEEAASFYERAISMANLLGNDTLGDRIAANLALTYGRLGRLEDQLKCAEERRGALVRAVLPGLTFS